MSKIIVLGAGVCGLAAGMLLAHDGHEVTVMEQDSAAAPGTPQEAWDNWTRSGVNQFRQAHFLLPAGRAILEQELPQVAAALTAAGAARVDLLSVIPPAITDRAPRPGDDRFTTLTARRPVLEQAFAQCAQATPGLDIRRGVRVAGLTTRGKDPALHVTGVRLEGGEQSGADLVVDAMGRRSTLPRWLEQAGSGPVPEQSEDSGYTYYSRFFRSSDGRVPDAQAPLLTALGSYSLLTLPADNHTWSVTVYISSRDQTLKRLRQPDHWTRLVASSRCTRTGLTASPSPTWSQWPACLTSVAAWSPAGSRWPPVSPCSPTPGRAPTPRKDAGSRWDYGTPGGYGTWPGPTWTTRTSSRTPGTSSPKPSSPPGTTTPSRPTGPGPRDGRPAPRNGTARAGPIAGRLPRRD